MKNLTENVGATFVSNLEMLLDVNKDLNIPGLEGVMNDSISVPATFHLVIILKTKTELQRLDSADFTLQQQLVTTP